jgi:hypothetical protein
MKSYTLVACGCVWVTRDRGTPGITVHEVELALH